MASLKSGMRGKPFAMRRAGYVKSVRMGMIGVDVGRKFLPVRLLECLIVMVRTAA
jgi:hypothetical protein